MNAPIKLTSFVTHHNPNLTKHHILELQQGKFRGNANKIISTKTSKGSFQ